MAKNFTVTEFFKRFADDDACLEHLMDTRYGKTIDCPKCGRNSTFSRHSKRPVYQCQWCSHQISPMAGTPFERSRTPLQKWFYAMYLFTTSRHGVPAKELQRQLGVTYKTAWRMGHEIRKYMGDVDGDNGFSGHVETDETYIGGKIKDEGMHGKGSFLRIKTIVAGIVKRDGHLYTQVVPNERKATLIPMIEARVAKGTIVSSDTNSAYRNLRKFGYTHGTVNHGIEEWTNGTHHTNTIEGFWSRLKNSIKGTHIHVSKKHLPKYLGEFEYRFNMRANPSLMFDRLLVSF